METFKKNIIHDFSDIEKDLEIQLHNSIKEYYNSYWFLDLGGNYLGYDFELNPVYQELNCMIFMYLYKDTKAHMIIN